MATNRAIKTVAERFWPKVRMGGPDDCWEWLGAKLRYGYGNIGIGGETVSAHRVMWQSVHGKISKKTCVLHRCDNPGCVNPKHLFIGSQADNIADMVAKKRNGKAAGEANGQAKLTYAKVESIRKLYAKGNVRHQDLAERFGVVSTVIGKVVRHQIWITPLPAVRK